MPNYQDGKIYKIVNGVNDRLYIGSTCARLCTRMSSHRWNARHLDSPDANPSSPLYQDMKKLGVEKFRMVLVEHYPSSDKAQLEAREYELMYQLESGGVSLYNVKTTIEHSINTRAKMRDKRLGSKASEETKALLSRQRRGVKMSAEFSEGARQRQLGNSNSNFKRGHIIKVGDVNGSWRFGWRENGAVLTKNFSIKRYGNRGAYGLALMLQDRVYPIEREL
jgi:group I intron endonuclease